MPEPVVVDRLPDRVVVRLNRPQVRNAISQEMVTALRGVCADLEEEPRIALIIGEGTTFAAGADIGELRARRRSDALRGVNSGLFDRIRPLPMPAIALIRGYAADGPTGSLGTHPSPYSGRSGSSMRHVRRTRSWMMLAQAVLFETQEKQERMTEFLDRRSGR